jgi:predicted  nucleic acid-binding Zn-ribbon protein
MNQRANDIPEHVLKFVPKEKAQNKVPQVDEAGQAIVAQIRTAADLAKEDCDRAMSLAHKLSMELRAAEDRTHEMEAEVEHWRERAARAEQWLRTIQAEIEEKLLVSHLSGNTKTAQSSGMHEKMSAGTGSYRSDIAPIATPLIR